MTVVARPMGAPAGHVIVERIGRDALSLRSLATLRMTVFRSWPYLYDGSADCQATCKTDPLSSLKTGPLR